TIVHAADGAHLVLSAQSAGEANKISVAQSGGDGGLAVLEYNPLLTTHYTEQREAKDAVIYVAGFKHTSKTNTFENAIDGVTITVFNEDEENKTRTLTIDKDTVSTTQRITKLV